VKLIREFFRSLLVEFFLTVRSVPTPPSASDKPDKLAGIRARNEGEQAAFFHGRRADNPYARGTPEFVAWDRGYLLIRDEEFRTK